MGDPTSEDYVYRPPVQQSCLTKPAKRMLLADAASRTIAGTWQGQNPKDADTNRFINHDFQNTSGSIPCPRHGLDPDPEENQVNILFGDGHVDTRTYNEMVANRPELVYPRGTEGDKCNDSE